MKLALVAATALVALAFAGTALAANTGTLTVSHAPLALGSSKATTIEVKVPQSTDPIAAVNIYVPAGYGANIGQAPGTKIGSVDALAFSRDQGLSLPLSGTVVTGDPASAASMAGSAVCTRLPQSRAVWSMNLEVAGTSLAIPVYVNPTAGAEQALGDTKLSICLPPPDVPVGTPGRSFAGAQLLEAKLALNGVFTTPTTAALVRWEALFTPYTPQAGSPNLAGTFEARAFVPLPVSVGIGVGYVKKSNTWRLAGKVSEGAQPVGPVAVHVARGLSPKRLSSRSTTKTAADGTWKTAGHLDPRRTTYFQATVSVGARDFTATGCRNPLTTVAPAGCVSATLPAWSAKSTVVKLPVVAKKKA